MKWFMRHWYDVGGALAIPTLVWAFVGDWSTVQLILLLNFAVILIHQFEEYRLPGGEAWITNEVFQPKGGPVDRYPLNQLNAAFINVAGWVWYFVPVFFPNLVWLGLGPVLFGLVGQFVVHVIVTNVKLKTFYNPGMGAVLLGHVPLGIWYIVTVYQENLIHWWDWVLGVLTMAFFAGVIMMRIGYGLLSPKDSAHPFDAAEMARFGRSRRLEHAGITPGDIPTP